MKRDRDTRDTLDTLSSRFFMLGLLSRNLKNVPVLMLAAIFNVLSMSTYLVGYMVWYAATLCYPDHNRRQNSWYGFAQFKEQFRMSAVLGTLAAIMCLIAPELVLPAAWIYAISNTLWSIGEYHKKQSPPTTDNQYSSVRQGFYLRYALGVTSSSWITTIANTIALFFPDIAFFVLIPSTVISLSLIATSAYNWGHYFFGDFPPDNFIPTSLAYNKMVVELGSPAVAPGNNAQDEVKAGDAPSYPPLFPPPTIDIIDTNLPPNCHNTINLGML